MAGAGEKGFSLLELVIVISIISATLVIIYPKFSFLDDLEIDNDARRLSTFIRGVNNDASAKRIFYRLRFTLGGHRVEAAASGDGTFSAQAKKIYLELSGKTAIEAVDLPSAKIDADEVEVIIGPSYSPSFRVRLKRADTRRTLLFNPYSGRVSISDGTTG